MGIRRRSPSPSAHNDRRLKSPFPTPVSSARPASSPPGGPPFPLTPGHLALSNGGDISVWGMVMAKGLRSRLAQYGDEEFALFLRRGFLKGAGFTDEALDRPIVGILSTASDFNPCHATAGRLADAAARGVRLAGALPFVFPTVSLHEAFSFPTSMLLRNLMAMDVEEMVRALP